jgi:peptide-methionine (S)-S-oxide reductase
MRQGNDVGTQYRSAIYWTSDSQRRQAEAAKERYGNALAKAKSGHGRISTEIKAAGPFYFAEAHHQQYLAKNPRGYCGLEGTGVACEIG